MADPKKKKKFLNLPKFTGGKKAYVDFLQEHMVYPEAALNAGISGSVLVGYEIDDNGEVFNAHIINGIGYGCDEEALRLIKMMRYEKVNNKGVRVRISTKTKIHFNLPATLTYTVTTTPTKTPENTPPPSETYGYTISF